MPATLQYIKGPELRNLVNQEQDNEELKTWADKYPSRTKYGRSLLPYMGDQLPKEIKPRVSTVMRDLAILRWMAKEAGEEVFMFTDDFKDFFCQFKLHPSITWTQCFVWLFHGEVCTYRELVMGFGGRPFSNIGQRFSNMLGLEFMRRLYRIQLKSESKLPAKLQAVLQYRRRFLRKTYFT